MKKLEKSDALIFIPKYNSHGKRDVTGAFRPEAKRFADAADPTGLGPTVITAFDNHKPMATRRGEVVDKMDRLIADGHMFDTVAFFCHGWADGMQAGFTRKTIGRLAGRIGRLTRNPDPVIPLYCCSTGDDPKEFARGQAIASPYHHGSGPGEGSFADVLRDEMCALGMVDCRVMGHTTVAHTTKNPHVLMFDGMGSEYGGVGGYRPVAPGSKLWKAWKRALRNTDLRFRFPYMTVAEIHQELSKGA